MPPLSSDELLIARLFDLPHGDRITVWRQACARDPALRTRHPELARVFDETPPSADSRPLDLDSVFPSSAQAVAELLESALGSPDSERIGPLAGILESALASSSHEKPGSRIGNYKLLQKIGEGGFGAVWMADQLAPIRRRVAVKIVKVGMDTEEVIARFEAERQALALMDHPNIARVFDAGSTEGGRPFFAMELVRGIAITRYCDDNRLTAEARLRLFIAVCEAVQHAHQKGVIHRDLKPSNILVTVHDGTPVPKVIDFGIAKATDKQLTEKTLVTQFHAFVGTPAYTSPEQMEMSGLDVDTRSDIYSLGVLLYELVAGRPPFDPDALLKSGLDAMRRTIREVDPPRPSHRLGTLNDSDRSTIAQARGTDPAKLSVLLRGDVDWIVMHCLEKDRTRRYETANALAHDVRRYLSHETVSARPPSAVYRLQKLYRRNRLAVTATTAVATSIIAGLIVASTLFVRERAARQRAVAAEKSEEQFRRAAESGRAAEALRASHTSLALAEQRLSEEGRANEGLAHLVRAARSDPANIDIGPRLVAALAYRSFAEPTGPALVHPTSVLRLFYTNHGNHCLSVGQDSVIRIWDLASGTLKHAIAPTMPISIANNVVAVDLSPDGRHFAAGCTDGTIQVWDVASGRKLLGPLRHQDRINFVQFSADGRRLASGGDDRTARIWDAATGEPLLTLPHEQRLRIIRMSPDGTCVVTATERGGPWRIWRLPDGKPVTPNMWSPRYGGAPGSAIGIDFSPTDNLVAISDNYGVQLFDPKNGAMVGARMALGGPCYGVAFTSDGKKLVTASDDTTARIWEVPTGRQLLPDLPHGAKVHPASLTPDNRHIVTSSENGVVRVWDVATGRPTLEPIHNVDGRTLDLSPDGNELMTASPDGVVRRWRIAQSGIVPFYLPPDPDRRLVARIGSTSVGWAICSDHMQRVDLLTGSLLGVPRVFPVAIEPLGLSTNQRFLCVQPVAGGDYELWDLQGSAVVRHSLGQASPRYSRFSPQNTRFAARDDAESLSLLDMASGALVAGPIPDAINFSFSPDDAQLALIRHDNSAIIWDIAKNAPVGVPMQHRAALQAAPQFSPDGRLVATASQDGVAQIWDAKSTRPSGRAMLHRGIVRGAVFTQDSRRLLAWTPAEVRVWDVATGSPLTEPLVGGNDVWRAGFNSDETVIATWARATLEVRLWSSSSGQLLADPIRIIGSSAPDGLEFVASDRFLSMTIARRGHAIWAAPPASSGEPVPDWLLRLATMFAGGEIDAHAVFRDHAFEQKDFDALRRELGAQPDHGPYVEWGRWLLADRATRPVAPGFTLTRAEAIRFAPSDESSTAAP